MRIHTKLDSVGVIDALSDAQAAGRVPLHVGFDQFSAHSSRSHPRAYDVHLGTEVKTPGRRRPQNSGNPDLRHWAATYDEWGWFLSALFDVDPEAKVTGVYKNADDFHVKTRYAFA